MNWLWFLTLLYLLRCWQTLIVNDVKMNNTTAAAAAAATAADDDNDDDDDDAAAAVVLCCLVRIWIWFGSSSAACRRTFLE